MIVKLEKTTFDYYLYRILLTKKIFEKRKRLIFLVYIKLIFINFPLVTAPIVMILSCYFIFATDNPNFLFLFFGYSIIVGFYICIIKHYSRNLCFQLNFLKKENLMSHVQNCDQINQNLIFYNLSKKLEKNELFESRVIDIISEYN
jgi:hypothetical protein